MGLHYYCVPQAPGPPRWANRAPPSGSFCTNPPPPPPLCPSPPLVLPQGGGGHHLVNPKFFIAALCCCVGDCVVGHCHLYPLYSWQDILLTFAEMELDSTTMFPPGTNVIFIRSMCVYGVSAVPLGGGGGDCHFATVPHGVVGDCLPWGGEGQGGGYAFFFFNRAKALVHPLSACCGESQEKSKISKTTGRSLLQVPLRIFSLCPPPPLVCCWCRPRIRIVSIEAPLHA